MVVVVQETWLSRQQLLLSTAAQMVMLVSILLLLGHVHRAEFLTLFPLHELIYLLFHPHIVID